LEASASIEIAKHTLVSCGLILAIGTVTGLLAQKIKIPDVAVFLVVGMLIGPEALGLIEIKADSALNQIILLFGASYILFDGGASLRFSILKQVWITIVALATLGVVVTAAITGLAAYYVFGVPLIVALLLGSALASTDPATLVPVFRQVKIRDRVAQTVVSESAFNDATGAIITFGVLAVAMGTGQFSLTTSLLDLLKQSVIGIGAGAALGTSPPCSSHTSDGRFSRNTRRWSRWRPSSPPISPPMACRPVALWRFSCSASCSATRKRSASRCSRAKGRNSKTMWRPRLSSCGCSFLSCSALKSISPS
jgi:hypothetical protein